MSTHHEPHGHHAHHDVSHDKGAAFVGLFGGLIVLGALMYAMVLFTNSRFAGHSAGGATPAAATAGH
jgi:hypothetical protein